MLIHLEPADIERFTAAGKARPNDLMDSAGDTFKAMAAAVREGDRDGAASSVVVVGDTLLQLCVTSAATWEAAENKSRFLAIMIRWAWPRNPALAAVMGAAVAAECQIWGAGVAGRGV